MSKTKTDFQDLNSIYETSAELLKESLFDIIKNTKDTRFKCHIMAKLGVNQIENVEAKLEVLFKNLKPTYFNQFSSSRSELDEKDLDLEFKSNNKKIKKEDFEFLESFNDNSTNKTEEINEIFQDIKQSQTCSNLQDDFDLITKNLDNHFESLDDFDLFLK